MDAEHVYNAVQCYECIEKETMCYLDMVRTAGMIANMRNQKSSTNRSIVTN